MVDNKGVNVGAALARIDGRIDGLDQRLRIQETITTNLLSFQTEMRDWWKKMEGATEAQMKAQEQQDKLQAERHAINSNRLQIIGIIVAILALAVGYLGYLVTVQSLKKGVSLLPGASISTEADDAPQNSELPFPVASRR